MGSKSFLPAQPQLPPQKPQNKIMAFEVQRLVNGDWVFRSSHPTFSEAQAHARCFAYDYPGVPVRVEEGPDRPTPVAPPQRPPNWADDHSRALWVRSLSRAKYARYHR